MTQKTIKLPSGKKLVWHRLLINSANLSFVYHDKQVDIPLEDVPLFLKSVREFYKRMKADQKELRKVYDKTHPAA